MKNINILDCTLRDGGRIIDCHFEDRIIENISKNLCEAGIEIIELGFLRSETLVTYKGHSTFFTDISQMDCFVDDYSDALYTAFIDYNMFDFDSLEPYRGTGVEGIRVGFTKKQYQEDCGGIFAALKSVKDKGYKLFVQSVNTPGYSDKELLGIIEKVNELMPYSFGIVDTYGALYLEDMTHFFDVVNHNLNSGIAIDVHSHNNMQSSFAFSQEIIRIAPEKRHIIFDSTLNGMGKCAGNLNTELIVDYLNRKKSGNYDLDVILDIIDQYLTPLKYKYSWGYSIPAFMAGIYKSHPNNIIYLTEKYRLKSKDIKYIISGIDEDTRQRYDYDNIARIYKGYFSTIIDDSAAISRLKKNIGGRNIVVLAPGKSILDYESKILETISEKDAITISINFTPQNIKCDYLFCANAIHWDKLIGRMPGDRCIVTSNVSDVSDEVYKINYTSLIEEDSLLPDNSTIMLLNLLNKLSVGQIMIAGFDGIIENGQNYVDDNFVNVSHGMPAKESNSIIAGLFRRLKNRIGEDSIKLLTPSLYSENF